MARDVTSRHLRSSTELTLFIPVRKGLLENVDRQTSFAQRLRLLLEALTDSIRVSWDRDRLLPTGPIDTLQSIQTTQWAVHERAGSAQLLVASCFDSSWEEYFHRLVDRTGDLLDAIFMHCDDYQGHACAEGYELFAQWIRANQVQNSFFYMAAPDLSVDDLRRARKLLAGGQPAHEPLGTLQEEAELVKRERLAQDPELAARLERSLLISLSKLAVLRKLFPAAEEFQINGQKSSAERIFDRAVASVLADDFKAGRLENPPEALKAWIGGLQQIAQARRAAAEKVLSDRLTAVDIAQASLEKIQGNILESYTRDDRDVSHGCLLLVQCDDAASLSALLGRLRPAITNAAQATGEAQAKAGFVNVALTYQGFQRLGLPAALIEQLPKEFREGMEARAGLLGDVGAPDYPDFWQRPVINWPAPAEPGGALPANAERVALSSVDVVVLLQQKPHKDAADDELWSAQHPLYPRVCGLELDQHGAHVLHVQPLRRGKSNHFGLSEKLGSQPMPRAVLPGKDLSSEIPEQDLIPLGELLLGYPDNRGETAKITQSYRELFADGSFLVMRKLEQDVAAFAAYTESYVHAGRPVKSDIVKSWIVGRSPLGDPLVAKTPTDKYKNDFNYKGDESGSGCPLHSHMRRLNPRVAVPEGGSGSDIIPRIMRRSFPFGPLNEQQKGRERGLMFMAYNASIATQFEVLQRWLNGANSTRLASPQNDLLSGVPQPTGAVRRVFVGGSWIELKEPPRPFVRLHWGLYTFVPSLGGIDALLALVAEQQEQQKPREKQEKLAGGGVAKAAAPAAVAQPEPALVQQHPGQTHIVELNKLDDVDARLAWKQLIEGDPSVELEQVWDAVRRAEAPVTARNYGLLIGTKEHALRVLCDAGQHFSVREYYPRLRETLGLSEAGKPTHYLGCDPVQAGPVGDPVVDEAHTDFFARRSGDYWDLAQTPNAFIGELQAPQLYDLAYNNLRTLLERQGAQGSSIILPSLIKTSIALLTDTLIGIPDKPEPRLELLEHFIFISRYSFQPYPDDSLRAQAIARGGKLRAAYARYEGPMQRALKERKYTGDAAVAAMGAIVGFAAPAVACMFNALSYLLQSGEFFRLHTQLVRLDARLARLAAPAAAVKLAQQALIGALVRVPSPPILYRTALGGGPYDVHPGDKVILGLSSIARGSNTPEHWLFGGEHGRSADDAERHGKPHHGCPARSPALGMMAGMLELLLRLPNVQQVSKVQIAWGGALPDPRA